MQELTIYNQLTDFLVTICDKILNCSVNSLSKCMCVCVCVFTDCSILYREVLIHMYLQNGEILDFLNVEITYKIWITIAWSTSVK